MNYGIGSYQGCKSKIAERIIEVLPRAEHFYDLFCGGGSITHCALMSGKWQHVHFSDIDEVVMCVKDMLDGNIPDGSEWVSREDFYMRKDEEPWIRVLWSFGGNGRDYIYGRKIEPYKKAVHEMIYAPTPNERRLKFKEVCRLMQELYLVGNEENTPPQQLSSARTGLPEATHRLPSMEKDWSRLQSSERTEQITPPIQLSDIQLLTVSRESTAMLESEQRNNRCREALSTRPFLRGQYDAKVCDYREVEILPNSIVYLDPPYFQTREYNHGVFDYDAFYDYCESLDVPVFISEYWMDESRFKPIAEWERISTYSATNNGLKRLERLYVPLKWYDKFRPIEQKSLFDDI